MFAWLLRRPFRSLSCPSNLHFSRGALRGGPLCTPSSIDARFFAQIRTEQCVLSGNGPTPWPASTRTMGSVANPRNSLGFNPARSKTRGFLIPLGGPQAGGRTGLLSQDFRFGLLGTDSIADPRLRCNVLHAAYVRSSYLRRSGLQIGPVKVFRQRRAAPLPTPLRPCLSATPPLRLLGARRVSLPAQAAPRSSPASRRTASGSDALRPRATSSRVLGLEGTENRLKQKTRD